MVFKNGLMSTISRYKYVHVAYLGEQLTDWAIRSMDPKPHVVGIAWVVECVEQRIKVDESRFAVNLQHMNIAGVNKVRLPCCLALLPSPFEESTSEYFSIMYSCPSFAPLHRDASRCCQSIIPPWRTRSRYRPPCPTCRVEARLFPVWVSEPTVLRGSLPVGGVRLKGVGGRPIRRVSVFRFLLCASGWSCECAGAV